MGKLGWIGCAIWQATSGRLPGFFIYFFKYETIETHARAFLPFIVSAVGSVLCTQFSYKSHRIYKNRVRLCAVQQEHGLRTPNEGINQRYLKNCLWQTKNASAIPKNLGLGLNFRPCSE